MSIWRRFYAAFYSSRATLFLTRFKGPNGILKRIEIEAAQAVEQQNLTALIKQRQRLENQTRRLSDDFLDLDLLDQQAREILGFIRTDEIIIR